MGCVSMEDRRAHGVAAVLASWRLGGLVKVMVKFPSVGLAVANALILNGEDGK